MKIDIEHVLPCILTVLCLQSCSGCVPISYGPNRCDIIFCEVSGLPDFQAFGIKPDILPLEKSGIVIAIARLGNVSQQMPCQIPMKELLQAHGTMKNVSTGNMKFLMYLYCVNRTEVEFDSQKNISNRNISISLFVMGCQINLGNISLLVEVFNIRKIVGSGWTLGDNMKDQKRSNNISVFPGLQKVEYLYLFPLLVYFDGSQIKQNVLLGPRSPLSTGFLLTYWGGLQIFLTESIDVNDDDIKSCEKVMPSLRVLTIFNGNLSSLPQFPWKKMEVINSNTTDQIKRNFSVVIQLAISGIVLDNLEYYQFHEMLEGIELPNNSIITIGPKTFSKTKNLTLLILHNNCIKTIPKEAFRYLTSLLKLDLSSNMLTYLDSTWFSSLSKLLLLDISHNDLKVIDCSFLIPLNKLKYLYMSNNLIHKVTNDFKMINMSNLSTVDFSNNKLNHIPSWLLCASNFIYANFTNNSISFGKLIYDTDNCRLPLSVYTENNMFRKFKISRRVIDLQFNNITSLDLFSGFENDEIISSALITYIFDLNGNNFACDCNIYNTQRRLGSFAETSGAKKLFFGESVFESKWKCIIRKNSRVMPISKVPLQDFVCSVNVSFCPSSCSCIRRAYDNWLIVNCTARSLSTFPQNIPLNTSILQISSNKIQNVDLSILEQYPNLRVINLSNNSISDLKLDHSSISLLDKLDLFYIHKNAITELPYLLTRLSHVNITLSGNRLTCNCKSKWVPAWLRDYYNHIVDMNDIKCFPPSPTRTPLVYMDGSKFVCITPDSTIIGSSMGTLFAIFIIVIICVYRFRGEIKLLLFAKFNWRPFDKTEDVDIIEKKFDAFISYSSEDKEWVLETLIPRLENDEHKYALCFDERNFLPGENIIENVAKALKDSRRVIMILTNNFLRSVWCKYEFQNAHKRVLDERCNYLIVLIEDDLQLEDLDEDMKLYLRTNTYIKMSSAWFWESLIYAMPKKSLFQMGHNFQIEDEEDEYVGVDMRDDIPLENM